MRRGLLMGLVAVGVLAAGCSSADQSALGLAEVETPAATPSTSGQGDVAEELVDTAVEDDSAVPDIPSPAEPVDPRELEPPVEVSEFHLRPAPPCRARSIRLSCYGADLSGWDFSGIDARFADFREADLTGARFDGASLVTASFGGATLTGASFEGADLTRADFNKADLTKANFRGADLTWAWVTAAVAFEANFRGANLTRTSFAYSELSAATWSDGRVCRLHSYGNCY
ncbi:MAG: pentapeptide repeat-containing protein [Candidatus Nanopelagicales bacterium]|nr:pentapeptide repeat-containing protein [Candidatus Nanopelagicales bacterium]